LDKAKLGGLLGRGVISYYSLGNPKLLLSPERKKQVNIVKSILTIVTRVFETPIIVVGRLY
jgi:hypothetical protein